MRTTSRRTTLTDSRFIHRRAANIGISTRSHLTAIATDRPISAGPALFTEATLSFITCDCQSTAI